MRRLVAIALIIGILALGAAWFATYDDDDSTVAGLSISNSEMPADLTDGEKIFALVLYAGRDVHQELGGEWDDAVGRWFLRRLAKLGFRSAQHLLAQIYDDGLGGVEPDKSKAAHWYRKAAERGHDTAQLFLGRLYLRGEGVEQSDDQAVYWVRKAAEQGNVHALSAMGGAYLEGRGVPRDLAKAVVWYRRAVELGDSFAQYALGVAYYHGRGVAQDRAEALQWLRKAAEQGEASAQFSLGAIYENGDDIPADLEQAMRWYRKAAEQGHGRARERLEALRR